MNTDCADETDGEYGIDAGTQPWQWAKIKHGGPNFESLLSRWVPTCFISMCGAAHIASIPYPYPFGYFVFLDVYGIWSHGDPWHLWNPCSRIKTNTNYTNWTNYFINNGFDGYNGLRFLWWMTMPLVCLRLWALQRAITRRMYFPDDSLCYTLTA